MTEVSIRRAAKSDAPLILTLLRELATFEKLVNEFRLTEELIVRDMLDENAVARCEIAYADGTAVGLAVWYWVYKSFRAQRGLFVEDLYVRPDCRGRSYGRALLVHLARDAAAAGAGWMEWLVLDWNAPAVAFYKRIGAGPVENWLAYRLEAEAITRLESA